MKGKRQPVEKKNVKAGRSSKKTAPEARKNKPENPPPESKFSIIFNLIPDPTTITEIETGKIIDANDAAAQWFGLPRDKAVGMTTADVLVWADPADRERMVREMKEKGEIVDREFRLRKHTGEIRETLFSSRFVELDGKKCLLSRAHDITGRRAEEKKLQQSLSLLKATLQSTADGILVVDADGSIVDFNDQFSRMWRIPQAVLDVHDDQKALDFVLDQLTDPDQFIAKVRELYSFPEAVSFDELTFKDGRIYARYSQPQILENKPVGRVWSFRDITGRKLAEATRQNALNMLQALLDNVQQGVMFENGERRIQFVNQTFCRMFGITSPETVIGDNCATLADQSKRAFVDPEGFIASIERRLREKEIVLSEEMRLSDGRIIERDYIPIVYGQAQLGNFWIYRDITERKKSQAALETSEEKYKFLVETTNTGYVIIDGEGKVIDANEEYVRMSGHGRFDEIAGRSVVEWTAEYDRARNAENVKKCLASGFVRNLEIDYAARDGRITPIEINANIISSGDAIRIFALCRDITERKQAEEKIRQNEQFIRNILDTVDEGFLLIDKDYRILAANKAYCSRFALSCDEVIGRSCYDITHKGARPCFEMGEECAVRQVYATGTPHTVLHKHQERDGELHYMELKAYPIKDAAGRVTSVIETMNDITEKMLLEEERLKSQKLESIGTLAGGIAHDFNNLLQGIFGYIAMAKRTIDEKQKSLAMLEEAEKALHQSVNLTTQLLTFSKGGKPVKKPVDLRPIIGNSAKFTLSGSRSDLYLKITEDLWHAEADGGQLGQVIQNIVLNADQAMPLGGTVVISATNMREGEALLPSGLAKGDYVMIAIQDTGVGIPEQYLSKIFDPYFTTKEKGSGLGLATSYSIVKNHGGMIDVRTHSGEGSTFRIYLPALAGEVRQASAAGTVTPALQSPGRILVMDDEELIRNLSRELLESLGHSVETASDGQEALDEFQQAIAAGKPFDLVILDLTVRGGMGGLETIQELLKIDPAAKVIVSSGYSDDAVTENYEERGFKAFLKKPYNVEELREVLNTVLARQ